MPLSLAVSGAEVFPPEHSEGSALFRECRGTVGRQPKFGGRALLSESTPRGAPGGRHSSSSTALSGIRPSLRGTSSREA